MKHLSAFFIRWMASAAVMGMAEEAGFDRGESFCIMMLVAVAYMVAGGIES